MMAGENLWGELPAVETERTPLVILREQCAILGELTENVLEGRVRKIWKGNRFHLIMEIVAPALDNYVYTVLRVDHGIQMYPLEIVRLNLELDEIGRGNPAQHCKNEAEYINVLRENLSSDTVRRVIMGLITLGKAEP
ncbi:MAG: hypothetical protein IID14_09790 [Candidatus Marinimicrobia bacterium]|nr:hypothetical protein [Candidatus Neomarinimicrobiota bacterium]